MKVNIDGFRKNLSRNTNDLGSFIDALIDRGDINPSDVEQLKEMFDEVSSSVGVLNCFYEDDDDMFNDISDSIKMIRLSSD